MHNLQHRTSLYDLDGILYFAKSLDPFHGVVGEHQKRKAVDVLDEAKHRKHPCSTLDEGTTYVYSTDSSRI